jgi:hypothetical protein
MWVRFYKLVKDSFGVGQKNYISIDLQTQKLGGLTADFCSFPFKNKIGDIFESLDRP